VFVVFGEFTSSSYREVLLVVSFPTKLVSSHSKFPCKSYLSFIVLGKRSLVRPQAKPSGPRPDLPALNKPLFRLVCQRGADSFGGPLDSLACSPAPPD
jgi:hypothetical protein